MNPTPTTVPDKNADTTLEPRPLAPVDPRITYPSYVSLDRFVDLDRLRGLDGPVRDRILRHLLDHDDPMFYTGPYTLKEDNAGRPGSRMIYLSRSSQPDSYFDLDRPELWSLTAAAEEFAPLMDFIATLPFRATGRMLIMYDNVRREVPAHRDHTSTEVLHDFVWFRTNTEKPFYMLNCETGEKKLVEGYTAWFDTVNQFHGSEPTGELAFSIRVDGVFTDEFKSRIPRPAFNASSTPSLWAAVQDKERET